MEQTTLSKNTRLRTILLLSIVVVFIAQVNVNLYLSNFKISIAIILFPLFLFLWNKIPILSITFLSGIGVFLSRAWLTWLQHGTMDHLLTTYFPEAIFYIVYGVLLFLFYRKTGSIFSHDWDFIPFMLMDFFANLAELILRFGYDAFSFKNLLSILGVAVIRTIALWGAVTILKRSHAMLLKREHAERYRKLLLLISKLNGEVLWMKKNTALIEDTMNQSYQLYNLLQKEGLPPQLTAKALHVAKDIHEVKKEYFIILRGISEALDLNLKEDGMHLLDLFKLLETTLISSHDVPGSKVRFYIQCNPALYTDKHYFFLSIFRNLFHNAMEATSGGDIEIHCQQKETDTDYLFLVEDHGVGIPQENLEQIFTPGFSTKINYTTGEVSRGLGLNLVADLVQNQFHGTIFVTSTPGLTRFTLTIPKTELKVVS